VTEASLAQPADAPAQDDRSVRLYRTHADPATRRRWILLGASAFLAAGFLGAALALRNGTAILGLTSERWLDVLCFAIFAGLGPYGYLAQRELTRKRRLEARFPDFLRDIAVARRSGLTLAGAVQVAARGDYGELTPHIRRMAEQLDWNVTFNEAMQRFSRSARTPLIERAVNLIEEASRAGGSVTDVIMAAARDAREIRNLEDERRVSMSLYVAIIYITFFVFLGVVAVMQNSFIPEILAAGDASAEAARAGIGNLAFSGVTLADYRTFYFVAALAQALGNGLVAGVIENGNAPSGLRHGVAMAAIAWIVFAFFV
jgi:flagellar protein FlaJ